MKEDLSFDNVSPEKPIDLLSDYIKPSYDKGVIVTLAEPSEKAVNTLLEILGERPNFSLMASQDKLELYAAARAEDNSGKKHFFSYQIPQRKHFIYEHGEIITLSSDSSVDVEGISSGDNEAEDLTEYSGTTSEDIERIETEYQVNRYRDFFHWCADGIDEALANSEAAVASLRAAAGNDELTSIAAGAHPVINYDYCYTFTPFGGYNYNGGRYNRTISRKNKAQYHIYSVHSFSTGSDFYLVKATLTTSPDYQETNPQRNYTDGNPAFYTHYHAGFTDYFITRAYID